MLELSCWNFTNHPGESTFLLGLLKPISGEAVKEEYPPINRVIAKKSTLNVKIYTVVVMTFESSELFSYTFSTSQGGLLNFACNSSFTFS